MKKFLHITLYILLLAVTSTIGTRIVTSTDANLSDTLCVVTQADTFIYQGSPNVAFGEEDMLNVGFFDGQYRALMGFNLDMLPRYAVVSSAELRLFSLTPEALTLSVYANDAAWDEQAVSWESQPAATAYNTVTHQGEGWQTWEVTTLAQAWANREQAQYGIQLRGTEESGATNYTAREASEETAPMLCITYEDPRDEQLAKLSEISERPIEVYWSGEQVQNIDMRLPVNDDVADPVIRALDHLNTYSNLYFDHAVLPQLILERVVVEDGFESVIFSLTHDGLPVYGSHIAMQTADGFLTNITFSRLADTPTFNEPIVTAAQARTLISESYEEVEFIGTPELFIYAAALLDAYAEPPPPHLAWRQVVRDSERGWLRLFVHAQTGKIISELSDIVDSKDMLIGTVNFTESSTCWILSTDDDDWFDENGSIGYPGTAGDPGLDGREAQLLTHQTYNWFKTNLGWSSWDDNDERMDVYVHHQSSSNAFYRGSCGLIAFGLDMVTDDVYGHEFTHAVVDHTSELVYQNQSGALNEAYADYFGTLVDRAHVITGTAAADINPDWTMGEDTAIGTIRNVMNPSIGCGPQAGPCQPDHMLSALSGDNNGIRRLTSNQTPDETNDQGFVHVNSGIINRAHYLIEVGGSNNGLVIDGLGEFRTRLLLFNVMTHQLSENATFIAAADRTVATVRAFERDATLGNIYSLQDVCDVINAFASVGLRGPDTDCDGFRNAPTEDGDRDGVPDSGDNCPNRANGDQSDIDGDGTGDLCDDDADGDTLRNAIDNCPLVSNFSQTDSDKDGRGNLCDDDDDDGILDIYDNCPTIPNSDQANRDGDSLGDVCDNDRDNDDIDDNEDNCRDTFNPLQTDSDGDNAGNACDNCVENENFNQIDTDYDGMGDVCDADDDNDGVFDFEDNCPLVANANQADSNGNGIGTLCDPVELAELNGFRENPTLYFDMEWLQPFQPIEFPILPCLEDCPNWFGPHYVTEVTLDVEADIHAQVVDADGRVIAKLNLDTNQLHFQPNADFYYDQAALLDLSGRENHALQRDAFTLQIFDPSAEVGESINIGIDVQTDVQEPETSVPTAVTLRTTQSQTVSMLPLIMLFAFVSLLCLQIRRR